jgi:hypothetical protein
MKNIFSIIVLMALSTNALAQTESTKSKGESKTTVGFEIDVVPYFMEGYYASAWVGFKGIKQRVRPVIAKSNMPKFLYDDAFSRNTINSYAIFTDYFFKPGFEKFWIATGIQYWDGEIENNLSQKAKYNEWIFTFGFGYAWKFYQNFYVSPWLAVNVRIAGDEEIMVGEDTFNTNLLTPDLSLKIGWHF